MTVGFTTDQRLAGLAVQEAVADGRLARARTLPCAECGAPAHGYHHRNGYAAAERLNVEPLCHRCHIRRPHPSKHLRYHENGKVDAIRVRARVRGIAPTGVTA